MSGPYWTKAWNPVTGCSPCSPGCERCWAERMSWRFSGYKGRCDGCPADEIDEQYTGHFYGEAHFRTVHECERGVETFDDPRCLKPWFAPTFHPDRLDQPLHWRKPQTVFVCNMGDLFHEAITDEQIAAAFGVMGNCPQHTFMVLTKRPQRMLRWFHGRPVASRTPNVWLGVTVCNQEEADRNIPIMLDTPAARRWLSVEPMLSAVDLRRAACSGVAGRQRSGGLSFAQATHLDWVVLGGESGPGARPMQPEWAIDLYRQTRAAGVPFFFKQWGRVDARGLGDEYEEMERTREHPARKETT